MMAIAQIAAWALLALFVVANVIVVLGAWAKAQAMRDFGGTDGD